MSLALRVGQFHSRMRFRFSHASADRSATENVIVEVADPDGVCGYGEGCPRDYVTGETVETARSFISEHGAAIIEAAQSPNDLQCWTYRNEPLIDANPAAFAAIELALLDYLGHRTGQPLESLTGAPALTDPVEYTAVIGGGSPRSAWLIGTAHRLLGFRDFKIKLNGEIHSDARRLAALPSSARVRVDANNFWADADGCIEHIRAIERPIWAIEEPVTAGDDDAMRAIASSLNAKIILDESLSRRDQLDRYAADPSRWIANIRVSKCGGILRAVRLAKEAQAIGLGVILGAHVGETSLLTRAALAVGQSLAEPPLAREGAYGTILLKTDLARPALRFGRGGRLEPVSAGLNEAAGMGLEMEPGRVDWH
ncbi:MAG: enolase C-terminal domain-like protein [Pseudomonadota bacterium]